jgi:hypothetical protein
MAVRNGDYSDLEELYHEKTLEEQFRYIIREEELKENLIFKD